MAPITIAADTVADVIGVPLAFSGIVIAHIQYGGREKMILTMPLAVPLATGPTHTNAHTSAHYLCFAFLRGVEEQAHVSPWITFKERQWEWFYSCRRKHSQFWFHKTTLSLAVYISLCLFLYFAPFSSSPFSPLHLTRWWVPRQQGLFESALPNQPPFASSMSAESSRWRWNTTPKETVLHGR